MEKAVIRSFVKSDEAGVVRLWREAFPDAPAHNAPEADIRRKLAVQPHLFLVASAGDRIVGTTVAGYDGHRGWIYYVAVAADCRRKGVGRMLVERAERELVAIGCSKVNLQVREGNRDVVAFYEALGYVLEPRVSMGKRIRSPER